MIIKSTAPSRISLFGGGSDLAPYCDLYGGIVISIAISLRARFTLYTGDDIFKRPGKDTLPYRGNPTFIHTILQEFGHRSWHDSKFDSEFDGYLESGLGSSASSAVAIIGALNKEQGLGMGREEIALKAWDIEVNRLGLFGGKQDQLAAVYGGVNVIKFEKERVTVVPLAKGYIEPLLPALMLFYTGSTRKSAVIQEGFKKLTDQQIKSLDQIKKTAFDAVNPIALGDVERVGAMLQMGWEYKKASNKGVTNEFIDSIFTNAIANGALGGKVIGAGGGGYVIFIVPPERQDKVVANLKTIGVRRVDFAVDWNGLETVEEPDF